MFLAVAGWAQNPDEGPILLPKKPVVRPVKAALLVTCDLACDWTLDGEPQGSIAAGGSKKVPASLGQHLVDASSKDGPDKVQKEIQASSTDQTIVRLELLPVRQARLKVEQEAHEKAAREQLAKEKAAREQIAKDKAKTDQEAKDKAAREQAEREIEARKSPPLQPIDKDDEAARANTLFAAGKRIDALPLYENLANAHPKELLYTERLADCLGAQAAQVSDPAELKAALTREGDAAKRAIELGETAEYIRMMANIDPNQPLFAGIVSPGKALLAEAEKAYTAGDFPTAMAKYTAAAEADPQLYEAPLYAGDTAYVQRDLDTAAKWFARAIAVDPNRETAYRYWGDAILKYGSDPAAARGKFIDAIVAEPYNRLAWQGLKQWAQAEKAVLLAPKIDRPAPPVVDAKQPNNIAINIDANATDDKQHPGASAWMMYSLIRAGYRGDEFKKNFPSEKEYRHTLREESAALGGVAESIKNQDLKRDTLDESLRNLIDLNDAGMLDSWILISGADQGIAQDYDTYRKVHRQLLRDYLARFVVHGGSN